MPSTRMTKDKIKTHWHYHRWIYLLIALLSAFALNMLFTVTAYHPPRERRLDVQLVGMYANAEALTPFAEEALETLPFVSEVEEINFYAISLNGDQDIYGQQKYMVMLGANEGDIYFIDRRNLEQLADMGALAPLDDYIERGILNPGERDLLAVTYPEPPPEEGVSSRGEHVYALQAEPMYALMDGDVQFDVRDKYMVLMGFSRNQENAALLMDYMMKTFEIPEPEWISNLPPPGEMQSDPMMGF